MQTPWTVRVSEPQTRIGVQVHALSGPWFGAGPAYQAADNLRLESFDDLAPYAAGPNNRRGVRAIAPGEAGSVSSGVTQRLRAARR